uniref:Uncharacterized protein n=1 Tax=Anguilla anguilla TaxID=7936 RepID=A0A0E9VLU0_ANGAN
MAHDTLPVEEGSGLITAEAKLLCTALSLGDTNPRR